MIVRVCDAQLQKCRHYVLQPDARKCTIVMNSYAVAAAVNAAAASCTATGSTAATTAAVTDAAMHLSRLPRCLRRRACSVQHNKLECLRTVQNSNFRPATSAQKRHAAAAGLCISTPVANVK
eukprot:19211-Heterococcus_DN1.PRE.2